MSFRKFLITALLSLPALAVSAQFYTAGDDPARARWVQRETESYKLVYPRGLDSLAGVYAGLLEKYKLQVGVSCGSFPGEHTRGKIPVILHPYHAYSNGSVAWAPKRMDLYTCQEMYDGSALPWAKMLAVHEQRHAAQWQMGLKDAQKPFGWFFGEMWNGLTAALYGGSFLVEGDAVVAETGLTEAGRGRQADFLNYYKIAFDNGDLRNWNKWRFGSQKYYFPNHYASGYMIISAIRHFYGIPDYYRQLSDHASRRPYDLAAVGTITKRLTGKNLSKTFADLTDSLCVSWKAEMDSRAPYMPTKQLVRTPRNYLTFSGNAVMADGIYSLREGIADTRYIVRIGENGQVKKLRPFSVLAGKLQPSLADGQVYWSETSADARWSLESKSIIRAMDVNTGHIRTLNRSGRLFNPAPSPSGEKVAAVELPVTGGSRLVILSADGKMEGSFAAPDSIQLKEPAWLDGNVYVLGISDGGSGIYRHCGDGKWECVVSPQPVIIKELGTIPENAGHGLMFTSDRGGSDELYHLDPDGCVIRQMTSTRYGGSSYRYSIDGKKIYFSANRHAGQLPECVDTDSLIVKEVDFADIWRDPIAETLSRQEKEMAAEKGTVTGCDSVWVAPERKYTKFTHLMNIHSWAPVYFNVDRIMNFSYDKFWQLASLGIAAVSQNELGTAVANFGYSAHKDADNTGKWRHSLHGTFSYTGWYPVIEASIDFNDRAAHLHQPLNFNELSGEIRSSSIVMRNAPYVKGSLSIYIPWSWHKGGWYSGLIPKVSYTVSNDVYDTGLKISGNIENNVRYHAVRKVASQQLSASLRGYVMTGTAGSAVYPHFGLGAEVGWTGLPGLSTGLKNGVTGRTYSMFSSAVYGYAYAYVPGFVPQQGLRLTAKYQQCVDGARPGLFSISAVNTLPRGLAENNALVREFCAGSARSLALTADYAIPIYIGEPTFGDGFIYIRRMVLTPHFDYSKFPAGNFYSAGATLSLDLEAIVWLALPLSIGVTASYNGGSAFASAPAGTSHYFVGPVFDISF